MYILLTTMSNVLVNTSSVTTKSDMFDLET